MKNGTGQNRIVVLSPLASFNGARTISLKFLKNTVNYMAILFINETCVIRGRFQSMISSEAF